MSDVSVNTVGDHVTLQRGTTYRGDLVGEPGPALLGLGSIEPGGGFRANHWKTFGGECPAKLTLGPGDLYVALKGATKDGSMIGSIARVPSTVASGRLTQDTAKLEFRDPDSAFAKYLYWLLRTPQYRDYCAGRATGTTAVALNRADFLAYPVPPMTTESRNLVAVFEAIDNKIELNRQMNLTLESIARAIFQSWFVNFDPVLRKMKGGEVGLPLDLAALFPASLESSALGLVPRGFQVRPLGELFDVGIGGAWGEDAPSGADAVAVRCLRGIDLHDLSEGRIPDAPVRYVSAAQLAKRQLRSTTLLVEGSGSFCGRSFLVLPELLNFHPERIAYSNFCKRLDLKCSRAMAIVAWMQLQRSYRGGEVASYRTGTAFPNLDIRGLLDSLFVVVPPEPLAEAFESVFLATRSGVLMRESRTQASLRDALLPRLIGGRPAIDVV